MRSGSLRILVLGSAAGGGFPQWNCACPNCRLAWDGDARVFPRTQSSLAVSADGVRWLLLNASPDLRQQIAANPALQPHGRGRHSPIGAVVLTNGDVDHVAGLLSMRERQAFTVYASAAVMANLRDNPIFGVLDRKVVKLAEIRPGTPVDTDAGVRVTLFPVPGKVPLYREGDELDIGEESGETVGVAVEAGGERFFYVPGCARVTPSLVARVDGAPLLFFDGTCFTDDEMIALGLSHKSAFRMGHVVMSGPQGSMAALATAQIGRRIFIHINNTNPVLVAGSPERLAVGAEGWEVAHDGLTITLGDAT